MVGGREIEHYIYYKTMYRCVSVCVYSGNSIDLNESFKAITAGECQGQLHLKS